ncbi:MAG: SDR family oxidoreductase [Alphaproteobacteria bacterium]
MDLGLTGKTALVCAASKGLGRACAMALAAEGVHVTITARTPSVLEATAQDIRAAAPDVTVTTVTGDIASEEGRATALAACPAPDILVNNAGGPPRGDFRDWDEGVWMAALRANMLTPIYLIQSVVDGMIARGFGRIVNITSYSVKAPIRDLGLSNGARAGLTGFVAGLARQTVRHNVTINGLLPGPFDTDRLRQGLTSQAEIEAAITRSGQANPSGRIGRPEELGQACAFLCSAGAGFITGQNIVLDGGATGLTL